LAYFCGVDSLTQIVLGAACGEAVLGKKIGNRALLFGAIGGTIPDLDVIIGRLLYSNEIHVMAFHRGFMHSFLFAIIGCFVFGWLTYFLYNRGDRLGTSSLSDWIWLYFWSIFTHPILDSFTPYGTQLFAPFSDYRVAFNTISVADPLYTIPFLLCLVILMFQKRNSPRRRWWFKAGVILSSCYLSLTVINKFHIDSVFEKSFEKKGINYSRFSAQPTILNNVLWYAVAETEDRYVLSYYSLFDTESYAVQMLSTSKNHELLDMTDPNLRLLTWFSKDYYSLKKDDTTGRYIYTDLRYPLLNPDDPNSAIFNFTIYKNKEEWDIIPFRGNPPSADDFQLFLDRVKGI
tara:strand:+ start:109366 stop:110406 length:1041 start_codon:yes stop_codon:yes gene_type:complete